jgi:hypothetical protein
MSAVKKAHVELDSLTLAGVTHEVFEPETDNDDRWKTFLKPLRKLRLSIQHSPPEGDDDGHPEYLYDAMEFFSSETLNNILMSLDNLRVLKLALPGESGLPAIIVENVLSDVTMPHLIDFGLSTACSRDDFLAKFLLRHASTLQRLSLSDLELVEGDRRQFFTRMANQLPKLCKIKLRGDFTLGEGSWYGDQFRFDVPGLEDGKVWPIRDAIERLVLEGGEWEDISKFGEGLPFEAPEGYISPGLPKVLGADDPALNHRWDEYDDVI